MPGDNSIMATQVSILQSPALAADVVNRLGLGHNPEFKPLTAKIVHAIQPFIYRLLPAGWAPTDQELVVADQSGDAGPNEPFSGSVVQQFLRRLSVEQQATSHVVQVGFTSNDPATAARVANAVVRRYLDRELAAKRATTDRAYQWATDQVHEIGREAHRD